MPHPNAINGRFDGEILLALNVPGDTPYHPCAEAFPADDVPRSTVRHLTDWGQSTVYAGTRRDIRISLPENLSGNAALLVCQDGKDYVDSNGDVRAIEVLDSLMRAGSIPPTVGVFIDPGQSESVPGQRNVEYDTMDDTYVTFIDDEVLPLVEQTLKVSLSKDPAQRIAMGISSGGICAFNMAWQRPESFGKVISHCGSFVNIKGGHEFPRMVRSTPRKPIKVFMQSGEGDVNIPLGSWPIANHQMADSLEYAGYDYRFEFGTGGHNRRHGGALFAESLRWLYGESGVGRSTEDDEKMQNEILSRIREVQALRDQAAANEKP
jgi:enterochelin esterase-like enzyme